MRSANKAIRSHKHEEPFLEQTPTQTVFGEPRNFLHNRFIYFVISQRARGLCVGVNLNPDEACNFNCVYCEVKRVRATEDQRVDIHTMSAELKRMLTWVQTNKIQDLDCFRSVPGDLLQLREVALSGNGEPTLCPNFIEVVQEVIHLRALALFPFFKIVLITNGTGLHLPEVQRGLGWLTARDEVWVKLDAGTQQVMERINRTQFPLEKILSNMLLVGRQRPIVVQSLFPLLHEQEPTAEDIQQYVNRLVELKAGGAQISLVQVYSAHRPTALSDCRHLSLQCLSRIAHQVREGTGLEVEVF